MKKIYNMGYGILLALGLFSCAKDAPFQVEPSEGKGKLMKSSLALKVKNVSPISRALTNGVPDIADFKVEIFKKGSPKAEVTETYGNMPEFIELPEGDYNIKVSYGGSYGSDANTAAFNAPHYEGESGDFKVIVDRIVSDIDPIVCQLKNIRVGVKFDKSLIDAMSPESTVTVKVGDNGTPLIFNKDTNQDGFFKSLSGSDKLTATFNGKVENLTVSEPKSYNDVKAGTYYILTFKLNSPDASGSGNIVVPDDNNGDNNGNNGFVIDADILYGDLNGDEKDSNWENNNDPYVEDDMRPEPGGSSNGEGNTDQPGEPSDPSVPSDPTSPSDPNVKGPQITTNKEVDLNSVNNVNELLEKASDSENACVLYVHCDAGIKEFTVIIDSEDLVNSLYELTEIQGNKWKDGNLDLINPAEKKAFLEQLLKREVGEVLIGVEDMEFNISNFLVLLGGFPGIHKFIVNVTDQNGKSAAATLQLEID